MRAKLALVGVVLLVLAAAWHFGVFAQVAAPRTLATSLVSMGAWGYLAFIVTYAVLQPFGVPGTVFVVAAPLIWPWPTAFGLSMVGTMAASVIGFSFARFVAREWVSARIPARLKAYDASLERSAFFTVVILRLILWMPQALHFFFGVSKVKASTHFWGSLVGYVPPLLAVSYLGSALFDGEGKLQPAAWPIMGGFLVVSIVIGLGARAWERRHTRGGGPGVETVRNTPPP